MTYNEAMRVLNGAIYDAISAGNKERQNVTALREMAADIDHIVDFGCTREEMREREKTDA
jgi:hypothetical protein